MKKERILGRLFLNKLKKYNYIVLGGYYLVLAIDKESKDVIEDDIDSLLIRCFPDFEKPIILYRY